MKGGGGPASANWKAPIRGGGWTRGGMARIAEVGHHVNCIPDCGLLKSGALHSVPILSPFLASHPLDAATPNWI